MSAKSAARAFRIVRNFGSAALAVGVLQVQAGYAAEAGGQAAAPYQVAQTGQPSAAGQQVCCRLNRTQYTLLTRGECQNRDAQIVDGQYCRRTSGQNADNNEDDGFSFGRGALLIGGIIIQALRSGDHSGSADRSDATSTPAGTRQETTYRKPNTRIRVFGLGGGEIPRRAAVNGVAEMIKADLPDGVDLNVDDATAGKVGKVKVFGGLGGTGIKQKWTVSLPMSCRGIKLARFSSALALVHPDREVEFTRTRNVPRECEPSTPTIRKSAARKMIRRKIAKGLSLDEGSRSIQVSEPKLEYITDSAGLGRLAWVIVARVDMRPVPLLRRYWVAAREQRKVLYWESLIHALSGHVTGNIWKDKRYIQPKNIPLPGIHLQQGNQDVLTDKDGNFDTGPGLSANDPLSVSLAGDGIEVVNSEGDQQLFKPTRQVTAAGTLEIGFNAAKESEIAQVSAFYWTKQIRELFKPAQDPDREKEQLKKLKVYVNIGGNPCNAFYDFYDKVFYYYAGGHAEKAPYWRHGNQGKMDTECPNTANYYAMLHEMGHALHDEYSTGFNYEKFPLSEGFADALAAIFSRSPCIAPGFIGRKADGTGGYCMRYVKDVVKWRPKKVQEDPYYGAGVYAGFVWKLIEELKAQSEDEDTAYETAETLVFGSIRLDPANIPDAVCAAIRIDDDDHNLNNGTPHYKELASAARSRELPFPRSKGETEHFCDKEVGEGT